MQKLIQEKPVIAIVGKPNVGKSTLFNLLARKALAIVHDRPGVTRDRRETEAIIQGIPVCLIDTAGYEASKESEGLSARMQEQTQYALKNADIILFVIDARKGLTVLDHMFAKELFKSKKPVVVIANKCENDRVKVQANEAYCLGFKTLFMVSAAHNTGIEGLCEYLEGWILKERETIQEEQSESGFPEQERIGQADQNMGALEEEGTDTLKDPPPLRIAIVGRPNAGKSTLINSLIGQERLITGKEAGITRDAVSIRWIWKKQDIRLVDTAGLRKKSRIQDELEKYSVEDSLRAIRLAEIVVLVLDSTQAFDKQDLFIMSRIIREGRGLVFACTKWDKIIDKRKTLQQIEEKIERFMPQARGAPLLTLSGLTGHNLVEFMPTLMKVWENWNASVQTSDLNQWLKYICESRQQPSLVQGQRPRLKYIAQIKARPPTFVVKGSRLESIQENYKRYLLNTLIESFNFQGASVRLLFRSNENPYENTKKAYGQRKE